MNYLMRLLAATGDTSVGYSDLSPIVTAITGQFTVANIASLIGSILGVGIGAVFLWWGGRKAVRSIMAAFKKGRASL